MKKPAEGPAGFGFKIFGIVFLRELRIYTYALYA